MSLDGLAKTHDSFRKLGSFDATIKALPLLKKAGIESHIEPMEYRWLLDTVWNKRVQLEKEHKKIDISLKDHLWTLYRYEIGDLELPEKPIEGRTYDGCHCAQHVCVLANGDLYACRRMESSVGNIRNCTFEEAKETEKIKSFLFQK